MKKIITAILFSVGITSAFGQSPNFGQASSTPGIDSLKNETDPRVLQQKITVLTQSKNEKDWMTVLDYYGATDQRSRKDSLSKQILKNFPRGSHALFLASVDLKYGKNGTDMEKIFARMKINFPDMSVDDLEYEENMIAIQYAEERNTAKTLEHLSRAKKNSDVLIIANDLLLYDASAAGKIVRQAMDRSRALLADNTGKAQNKEEYADNKSMYYRYIALYSKIQIKLGNNKEALKYAKEAYDNRSNASVTDGVASYGYLLGVTGQYQEALPILEQLYMEGKFNDQLNEQLRISYQKVNPGKDGTAYLANIQASLMDKLEEKLVKTITNDPAPDFYVTDISGKKVSLADFKGKTIVLDFWATWCAPCKASFPRMQLTVERYKNDPQVAFLFIHTKEASTTPFTDAKDYLSANNYRLPLYMDVKDPVTKVNPAAAALHVSFIPAKLVIDGKGMIRFRLIGFSTGENEAHVNELSAMIELARKNS